MRSHWYIATDKAVILFLSLVLIFKTLFIAFVPLELSADEAYYWDWSRHLDWGYYSKPPMVAWLMAFSTKLLGNTEVGVRSPAALLSVLGLWFLYKLAQKLYSKRAAIWALLAILAAPGTAALSFIMTIDAPLICFWSVGLYVFWKALQSKGYRWWLLSGIVVGLGLLSKQTMVAFMACAFVFMLVTPYRRFLLTPMPYVAAFVAFLMIFPTLWWNYQHQWITFQHTAHHFEGVKGTHLFNIMGLIVLLGSQITIMSPFIGILGIIIALKMPLAWNSLRAEERYLFCFGPLPFLLSMLLALRQDVNANWPAPFCITFFLLLAGAWDRGGGYLGDRLKTYFKPAVVTGLLLVLIIHAAPFFLASSAYAGSKWDITARLKGGKTLAKQVSFRLAGMETKEIFLLSTRRQIVSQLAFYLPHQPQVLCWPEPGRIKSQYDLWPAFHDKKGYDALIILERKDPLPLTMHQAFESLQELPEIEVSVGQSKRCYRVLYGKDFKGID